MHLIEIKLQNYVVGNDFKMADILRSCKFTKASVNNISGCRGKATLC